MDISKENPVLFSISAVELGCSILVGGATWLGLSKFLHSAVPYSCGRGILTNCGQTEQQLWETLGKPLFSTYAIPLVLFMAISGIFIIRCIRKDVRHFSTLGNLAFSFPIFAFLGFFLLSFVGLSCLPLGLLLSVLATIYSMQEKNYRWTWISLPFNLAWFLIFGSFIGRLLYLYGD